MSAELKEGKIKQCDETAMNGISHDIMCCMNDWLAKQTWQVTRKGKASEKAVSDCPPVYQPLAEDHLWESPSKPEGPGTPAPHPLLPLESHLILKGHVADLASTCDCKMHHKYVHVRIHNS